MRTMMSHLMAAEKAYAQLVDLARLSGGSVDIIASELNVSRRFAERLLEGVSLQKALIEDSC